jgi:tRNA (guanine37-N1)-methyltransferase
MSAADNLKPASEDLFGKEKAPTGISFHLITLFPGMLQGFLQESILGRAVEEENIAVHIHDLRNWGVGKHRVVDDRPLGGGPGMLLKPEPVFDAVEFILQKNNDGHVIYLCPDGEPLTNDLAREIALMKNVILISGHYEGLDQRVRDHIVDREVSIGDYVLTNGTLAAAVLIDAVSRQIPGVLGEEKSLTQDSFEDSLLAFPQYTRPAVFREWSVPDVLISGNHQAIAYWRKAEQLKKTEKRRPDLISHKHYESETT